MSNMNLHRWALILAVAASFTASAWATSIDFAGIGNGGSWSWDGSGPLSVTDGHFSLTGTVPGDVTGAGDLVLADPPGSPTPEPVSMVLVGTGLLAIGVALRFKRFGLKGEKLLKTVPVVDQTAARLDARVTGSAGPSKA